jgi:hypothetical protein
MAIKMNLYFFENLLINKRCHPAWGSGFSAVAVCPKTWPPKEKKEDFV